MTTCACCGVMERSTNMRSPFSMPASRIASPVARMRKVAYGWRMRTSLRSNRATPESCTGEPKLMATLDRTGRGSLRRSRPTRTQGSSGVSSVVLMEPTAPQRLQLYIHPVTKEVGYGQRNEPRGECGHAG